MIPLLRPEAVKRAEEAAIQAGTSETDLMLLAGNSIADLIDMGQGGPGNVVLLCGPGNNGGDGLVIGARLSSLDWNVTVWLWNRDGIGKAPVSDDATGNFHWVDTSEGLQGALVSADVVVDAIFGAGSRADLPDEVANALQAAQAERTERFIEIWAVDNPSGVSANIGQIDERAVGADVTMVIGLPKIGLYREPAARYTGRLIGIDIGLEPPEDIDDSTPQLITASVVRRLLPDRRVGTHKRSAGALMVVGGAPNYYGAPRLTAESALRSGAGLVMVAAPSSVIPPIATAVPELTFVPLPMAEHATAAGRMASIVLEKSEPADALVIGPGLGTDAPVPEFLTQLLGFERSARSGIGFGSHAEPEQSEPFAGRAVIDADGLNWLAEVDSWWTKLSSAELVLTPHAGELGRLLGRDRDEIEADPWEMTKQAAEKFQQVVVLKHAYTVVATPDGHLYVADQAPVGLATAGTGDVLAGSIGAFLAQGLDAISASLAGIALGLRAAALVESQHGTIGYTATDIIAELPAARDDIVRTRSRFG